MAVRKPETLKIIKEIKKKYSNKKDYYGYIDTLSDDDRRVIKYDKQYQRYGFDNSVTWTLYVQIASFILPRLTLYRDTLHCYPYGSTYEEWEKALTDMIVAFELIVEENWEFDKKKSRLVKKGLKLYHDNFFALWN